MTFIVNLSEMRHGDQRVVDDRQAYFRSTMARSSGSHGPWKTAFEAGLALIVEGLATRLPRDLARVSASPVLPPAGGGGHTLE